MRLKSFVRPTRGLTTLVAVGTITVGMCGFAAVAATSASADPSQVFTVVGSDTVQDFENGFALDEGDNLIGSWNATDPVTQAIGEVITPNNAAGGQCSFTRPDGSGQGLAAFRKSINPNTTAAQLADPPQPNCIDWSRSSSGPGTNQANDGTLVYIPFALDAVTGAISSASVLGGGPNDFTLTDLENLYANCTTVTEDGITYDPNTPVASGDTGIDLYVPQSGSGTLTFWASTLGFSATTLPACVHQTILAGPSSGDAVEENDGTAVTSDPNGYMPFSIAQWVSQRNGHDDRRHSAVELDVNGVSPCGSAASPSNCSGAGTTLNTSFPITRLVYNIAQYNEVVPAADGGSGVGFNSQMSQLLFGTTSLMCRDVPTILSYGFALLNASSPSLCGATTANLRAFDPNTNPV
jgi:ABC-type phosphate transport system substrate-binding protein